MNLSRLCCLCLLNNNELQSIYDFDTKDISLHEKIKYCDLGSPETLKSDLLPLSICKICSNNLQIVYEFKRLIVKNSNKLRDYISQYLLEKKTETPIKFEQQVDVEIETKTNKQKYVCDVCNKSFTQKGNLKTHQRTHTNEKPYLCDVCSRSFARSGELSVHKRIHNNIKPFTCTECNKTFRQQSTLNNHKRVHTKEKPFFCDICENKSFTTLHNLKTHKLINHCDDGERDFACEVCNKSFAYMSILKTHRLVHTGERKYSCDVCNNRFSQPQHLKRHMRIHTKVRPFFCDVCDCTFTQKHHLMRHKRKLHEKL